MKKLVVVFLFMGAALLMLAPPASAAIKSISANDLATSYVYAAGSGTMMVTDVADIVVEYMDSTQFTYTGGNVNFTNIALLNDYSTGGQADADFVGGQLLYTQGAIELLRCNLLTFALTETRPTSNLLAGLGSFQVVSGTLMPDFGPDGDIFWIEFRLSIPITDFQTSFTGRTDTTIVPLIPEPATLAILGLGGLLLRRRMA